MARDRSDLPMESIRSQICPIWPTDDAVLVDLHLGNEIRVTQGFKDRADLREGRSCLDDLNPAFQGIIKVFL